LVGTDAKYLIAAVTKPSERSLETVSIWRLDDCLLMPWGAQLDAARCVKCNAPSDGEVVVNSYPYHSRLFYITSRIFPVIGFYRTFTAYTQKDVNIGLFICAMHRKRRNPAMLLIRLLGVSGILLFILNISTWRSFGVGAFSGFMCVVSIDFIPYLGHVLRAERINEGYIWLSGADARYLAAVPVIPMERRRFDSAGGVWLK